MKAYGSTAKAMHWLIAVLILTQYVISVLMPDFGPHTVPGPLINLHLSFGILILVLMAVRVIHRWVAPVPLDMPDAPPWERRAARATHIAFYVILLFSPFLGWASASAHNVQVVVFGLVPLPDLAAPKAGWALAAGDIHIYLMWTLLALIGLHVAGALYHHFVRHDGVLRRMWPGGQGPAGPSVR
ncbi:MAG: cytochrome b [Caldimonas sp.]